VTYDAGRTAASAARAVPVAADVAAPVAGGVGPRGVVPGTAPLVPVPVGAASVAAAVAPAVERAAVARAAVARAGPPIVVRAAVPSVSASVKASPDVVPAVAPAVMAPDVSRVVPAVVSTVPDPVPAVRVAGQPSGAVVKSSNPAARAAGAVLRLVLSLRTLSVMLRRVLFALMPVMLQTFGWIAVPGGVSGARTAAEACPRIVVVGHCVRKSPADVQSPR
jgi:hypothetical protein